MTAKTSSDRTMDWIAEADYIAREAAKIARGERWHAGTSAQFTEYCRMQANSAERDGFTQIAADIRIAAGV